MKNAMTDGQVARELSAQGEESAQSLRSYGWQGGGAAYDVGTYFGDIEAAAERIGRGLSRHEIIMLEASVRTHLDAGLQAGPRPLVEAVMSVDSEADAERSDRDGRSREPHGGALHACFACGRHPETHLPMDPDSEDSCPLCGLGDERS